VTRRLFSALPAALAAAPPRSRIAIFSKHLHWLPIAEAAAFAKETGFDALDLTVRPKGHLEPAQAAELPRAADAIRKAGLELAMITTAIQSIDTPHAAAILAAARDARVTHFRWGGVKYRRDLPITADLAQFRESSRKLEGLAAKHQLCGIYHTHSGTNELGASIWDLVEAFDGLDPNHIAINFDIGHATVEGGFGGWINSAHRAGSRIRGVAVKDFLWAKNSQGAWRPAWKPIGEGMAPLREFFALARKLNLQGPIQLHCEYPLGGADHGDPQITVPRDEVQRAMRRDLQRLREAMA
jgi:sugar phosphate isomerase/epimerase